MADPIASGEPNFLTLDEVLQIHAHQIEVYGGADGVRDMHLLDSAIAQPRQMHADQYLHNNLAAMAAAYLFHLVKNHPFVDGNKRTGVHAAMIFFALNGLEPDFPEDAMECLTLGIASGQKTKNDATVFFHEIIQSHDP